MKKKTIFTIMIVIVSMFLCACGASFDSAMIKADPSTEKEEVKEENIDKKEISDEDPASEPKPEAVSELADASENNLIETPYKEIFERKEINYDYSGADMIFKAKTVDGEDFDAASWYKNGKITVLTVWSTSCSACIQTMPVWGKLAKEYEGSGVQFLGICEDAAEGDTDTIAVAKEITAAIGADYLQLIRSAEVESKVLSNMMYLPTTFFVGSDGKTVCAEFIGYAYETDWIDTIETIMADIG